MTTPDPTATFRDDLWRTIVTTRGASPRGIVDALEPVIQQIVAAELRDFADTIDSGRNRPIAALLRTRAAELDGGAG